MSQRIEAVVFDIGNVLVRWDRRLPYVDRFDDPAELDWFMDEVIPLSWHAEHDAGRSAAELVAERSALFPAYAQHIHDWFARFNESIPGPVPGSPELVERLDAAGMPLYAITNFGADTWAGFHPTFPLLKHFGDIVVSGVEKLAKPDPAIMRWQRSVSGVTRAPCCLSMIACPTWNRPATAVGTRTTSLRLSCLPMTFTPAA